jgi:CDP-diacylglycerol---glycerol-3-phosphate 3-phosphatidyltransferase
MYLMIILSLVGTLKITSLLFILNTFYRANLSKDYFTNRQDRYILIKNSPPISNYFAQLISLIGSFSNSYDGATNEIIRTDTTLQTMAKEIHRFSTIFRNEGATEFNSSDTVVTPVLQIGPMGIFEEEDFVLELFGRTETDIVISSAYLNLPESFQRAILNSKANFKLLTSAPEANGFYGSKGFSRFIPEAYTYLTSMVLNRLDSKAKNGQLSIVEYKRPEWTFHAKGSSDIKYPIFNINQCDQEYGVLMTAVSQI